MYSIVSDHVSFPSDFDSYIIFNVPPDYNLFAFKYWCEKYLPVYSKNYLTRYEPKSGENFIQFFGRDGVLNQILSFNSRHNPQKFYFQDKLLRTGKVVKELIFNQEMQIFIPKDFSKPFIVQYDPIQSS